MYQVSKAQAVSVYARLMGNAAPNPDEGCISFIVTRLARAL